MNQRKKKIQSHEGFALKCEKMSLVPTYNIPADHFFPSLLKTESFCAKKRKQCCTQKW